MSKKIKFFEVRISHSAGEVTVKTIKRNGSKDVLRSRKEAEALAKKLEQEEDYEEMKIEIIECEGTEPL